MLREMTYYGVTTIMGVACLGLLALCMVKDVMKGSDFDTPDE